MVNKEIETLETNCYKIQKQITEVSGLWHMQKNELPTAGEMQDAFKIIKSLAVASQVLTNVFESGHQNLTVSNYVLPRLKRMCAEIKSSEKEASKLDTKSIHELAIRLSSSERANSSTTRLELMGSPEYLKMKSDFRRIHNIILQATQLAGEVAMYFRNA